MSGLVPSCRPFTEPYDRAEIIADAIIHTLGLSFAVFGLISLAAKASNLPGIQSVSLWVYSLCMAAVFSSSAAYNFWPGISGKLLLRRVDQSVIFLFIAATYTPLIVHAQDQPDRALVIAIWGAASMGAILKLGYPGRFERLSIILCLVMGWSGLFAYDAVFGSLSPFSMSLIVGGGVLYSVGVAFHLWERLRFQNAIWHAFVVTAAMLHFCAILES